ncbi:MAG: prepilin peptidase, partial [Verrucomicrobiota bacterium]|nr:prepilin peptidase [Verrucomicrobiota bacterium]
LTALLFLAVWLKVRPPGPWILVLPFWILVSLLIVATFIDLEHFIIPNEISWGGVVAGVLLSFAIPQLMGSDSNLISAGWSLFGAAVGYGALWIVVELGKKAFGKKRIRFEEEQGFEWRRIDDDAEVVVGDDKSKWSDFFSRETDRLLVRCATARLRNKQWTDATLQFSYDSLEVAGETFALAQLDEISAQVTEITIPREAMGFGDVKFIAAIGAFLGWPAVFFTIVSASMLGAVIGLLTILAGKRAWSAKIPFGPYLALGALIWLFFGWEIVGWYLRKLTPDHEALAASIHWQ